MKRVMTLVVQIEDAEAATVIWDAHREAFNVGGVRLAGCTVLTISDGDLLKHVEQSVDAAVTDALEKHDAAEDHRR